MEQQPDKRRGVVLCFIRLNKIREVNTHSEIDKNDAMQNKYNKHITYVARVIHGRGNHIFAWFFAAFDNNRMRNCGLPKKLGKVKP